MGRDFVDTDEVFLAREHLSVQDYLRTHDEADFRRHEIDALTQSLTSPGVVATGGGIVTTRAGRELLRGELTLWLDCPDDVLASRVVGGDRPLLDGDTVGRLSTLRAQREAHYRQVSRFRVDASEPLDVVVQRLLAIVENARASS